MGCFGAVERVAVKPTCLQFEALKSTQIAKYDLVAHPRLQ